MNKNLIITTLKALTKLIILSVIFSSLVIMLYATIHFIFGLGYVVFYEFNLFIAWIEFLIILITIIALIYQFFKVIKNV